MVLEKELSSFGINIQILPADLSQKGAASDLFGKVRDLDFAVNNAGTEGRIQELHELESTDYDHVFDLNVRAVFDCLKHEIQILLRSKKPGCLVNVSSILGLRAIEKSSLYIASKHAVIGLTKTAAIEQIKNHIRINAVCPGLTNTAMAERILGKENLAVVGAGSLAMSQPSDIAEAIVWLCSDASKMVIGHALVVDGGTMAQ